jgi:MFS family permease
MADRWGNLFVIRVCALLLSMVPLLYLGEVKIGEERRLWPLYLGWIIGGGVWAGINLASFNFVTATATPRRRVRCYAYLQTTIGLAVALYMFGWGALTEYLPIIYQYKLQTVFLFSAFLRLLPTLGLIYIVKDRTPVPDAKISEFLAEVPLMLPNGQIMRELLRPLIKPQRLWNMVKK